MRTERKESMRRYARVLMVLALLTIFARLWNINVEAIAGQFDLDIGKRSDPQSQSNWNLLNYSRKATARPRRRSRNRRPRSLRATATRRPWSRKQRRSP